MKAQGHSEGLLESGCSMILVAICCFRREENDLESTGLSAFRSPRPEPASCGQHRNETARETTCRPTSYVHAYIHAYRHTCFYIHYIQYIAVQRTTLKYIAPHDITLRPHTHMQSHNEPPLRPCAMSRAFVSRCSQKNCVVGRAG